MTTKTHHQQQQQKRFLIKKGNLALVRLLLAIYDAEPDMLNTSKLLKELGSVSYGQRVIKRAVNEKYIERVEGKEPLGKGQFPPVFYKLTQTGRQVLLSQLS